MGGLSLLAASLVVAALGFGWVNAIKDGVFDVWSAIRGLFTEEAYDHDGESIKEDAMMERETDAMDEMGTDLEYDEELDDLESELDALLEESDAELDALEGEL